MSREFEDALDDCLERMSLGENIRHCVNRYPLLAKELTPLLRVAEVTRDVAASVSPSTASSDRGLVMMAQAYRNISGRRLVSFFWNPVAKPLVVGFVAVMLTALAAGGTTAASSDSVPGESLYWVKTVKENISLSMPGSSIDKAHAHAHLASVRGQEMRRLISRGNVQEAEHLMSRIRHHLDEFTRHADISLPINHIEAPYRLIQPGKLHNMLEFGDSLEQDGNELVSGLSELSRRAPTGQADRVQRLMRRSELRYRILIDALRVDDSPKRGLFWRIESLGASGQ